MKQKVCVLLAVAFLMTLSACGVQPQAENQSGDQNPETTPVITAPPVATLPPPAVTVEPVPLPVEPEPSMKPAEPVPISVSTPTEPELERPSDEEVIDAYWAAKEAYSWFDGYSDGGLMVDKLDVIALPAPIAGGEWTYCRVTRPGLDSVNELRVYLKTLFSDEVVDELLNPSDAVFADGPDGGLYILGAERNSNVLEEPIDPEVLWQEAGPPTYMVQTTAEEPVAPRGENTTEKIYAYPYQKVGDKWVFTQFGPIM